ncbi:MAG TPA: metallophosphoesterase [Clostridia bacterium]|nr:metallophosphoesterase [Clostridia bacterium]
MKIAILSDIHDNLPLLRRALERCREADVLICCGDLCSPFVVKELGQGFAKPLHIVFGNNDGDRFRIALAASKFPHLVVHGEYAELELDSRTFSINHFDNIGRAIAKGGQHDVVCFGHNHQFEITTVGKTLIINPGEIYGGLTGRSTFAIYDTTTGQAAGETVSK